MSGPGRVGPVARALGFAGLLPAFAAACLLALQRHEAILVALIYPAIILSFLGGLWWSIAMRRETRQGSLALLAVVPSLVATGLLLVPVVTLFTNFDALAAGRSIAWTLIALGSAVLLTLPVDRHLSRTGEAPENWMRLRGPLSVGLGCLTIVSGVLVGLRF